MTSGQPRSPECAASLAVVDLARSQRYYREALGFETISGDGRVAVVEGHGVRLELREDATAKVAAALARNGLTPAAAEELVRRHLAEERGLSPAAVDAVVRRPS